MLSLLACATGLAFYDRAPDADMASLASRLGLTVTGITAVYLVFLRPGLPWVEPVPRQRWWTAVILIGLLLGVAAWFAPAFALFEVPFLVALWASAGTRIPIYEMLGGATVVVALVGIGMAAAVGWTLALMREAPTLALTVVIGLWLRSSWRWTAERRTLLASLEKSLAALTTAEHEAGVLAERERLASEIHGTIAQSLVAIAMTAERAQDRPAAAPGEAPELAKDLQVIVESAAESLADARALISLGARLESTGPLDQVLRNLGARFSRETDIAVDTSVALPADLPDYLRLVVLRTAQEGLANIRKHAHATEASIGAVLSDGRLRIEVIDNGVGPPKGLPDGGFGLQDLRDRLNTINGTVELRQRADRSGAVLEVSLNASDELEAQMTASSSVERSGLAKTALGEVGTAEAFPNEFPDGEALAGAAIRVLVVDDHPVVREGLVELLNRAVDIDVVGEAATGEEAVALARETEPQVVTMDLEMPGKGGVWATQQILADAVQAGRETRVLAVTVFESASQIVQAMRAGAVEYLIKTGPRDQFAAAVRRAAAGHPLRGAHVEEALGAGNGGLSRREVEVLRLAARGLSNKEIARELMVQPSTIKTQLSRVYLKLDVPDRTAAVAKALAQHWI
jgi:DNA-binding NarL/FixJ family response regulator/signal transduction histidine kinase